LAEAWALDERSAYVFSLCREKALQGDVQMMMVREPAFHSEMLMQGAFRALMQRHQGRVQVVREPPKQRKLGLAVPQAKRSGRKLG
jgi:hypothetical protein